MYLCCRFGNNRGVNVAVEQGGRSGTKFNLFQSSYGNLTNYLVHTMGYTLGKDLFAAPYDWRMHISGLEQSGQMDILMARIENAVTNNCGKRAILIGHSMGGLVSVALLQRDSEWR
jgi:pimeloyl-ACP methyl ester carboxylesterase